MNRIFRDEEQQRRFERDGFVVSRLMPTEAAAAILEDLSAMQRGRPRDAENRQESGFYASFLDRDLVHRRNIYRYLKERLEPGLDSLVDGYKIMTATFLEKPPGGGEMDLHCDETMTADPDDVNFNIWCPLVDVDESNGALQLVAGSQRLVPHITAAGIPTWFAHCRSELKARSRSFTLRAGEALIYDSTMPHWSPPNRSGNSRFAIGLLCVPRHATPALYLARSTPEGPMFELVDMSDDGYYRHGLDEIAAGTVPRRSLGLIGNRNRTLSPAEFERRMAAAARRRRVAGLSIPRRWMARIRTRLSGSAPGAARAE